MPDRTWTDDTVLLSGAEHADEQGSMIPDSSYCMLHYLIVYTVPAAGLPVRGVPFADHHLPRPGSLPYDPPRERVDHLLLQHPLPRLLADVCGLGRRSHHRQPGVLSFSRACGCR